MFRAIHARFAVLTNDKRPYVIAVVASVPISVSIAMIWLIAGGDETCGPNGCDVEDAIGFSGLLLSYVAAASLYVAALIRRSWGQRILIGVLATLILLVISFPLLASLGHNPQGNYCRYLAPGQDGGWLAITMEGDVCEIIWRRWLATGAPWTWVFWVGGFTIFGIHRLKHKIESRA
jgi:hypothetical protein